MAINRVPAGSILKFEVQVGLDPSGNPKFANISFYDVKHDAIEQNLYDTATALSSLQSHPLNSISITEKDRLEEVV